MLVLGGGGAGAWVAFSGGDGDATVPTYGVLWTNGSPSATQSGAKGVWLLEDTIVLGRGKGLYAYDQATGKRTWSVQLPGDGARVCDMSLATKNGVGAVTYGPGKKCGSVMAVDARSGKELWHGRFVSGDEKPTRPVDPANPLMLGELVIVQYDRGMAGFRARDGELAGRIEIPYDACPIADARADGSKVLLVRDCLDGAQVLQQFDPATGKMRWSRRLRVSGGAIVSLVSSSPPLVYVLPTKTKGEPYLLSLTESGERRAKIQGQGRGGTLDLSSLGKDFAGGRYSLQVEGNTLIATTYQEPNQSARLTNKVVGVDLATGERRWVKSLGPRWSFVLVGGDTEERNDALVLGSGGAKQKPALLRFDPADGSIERVATYTDRAYIASIGTVPFHQNGLTFFVAWRRDSGSEYTVFAAGNPG